MADRNETWDGYDYACFLLLAIMLLLAFGSWGCSGYQTFVSPYSGASSQGATLGVRSTAYLDSSGPLDGGVGVDGSWTEGDDSHDIVSLSPLLLVRYRPTEFLEPYLGAGPSFLSRTGDQELGADFRLGARYRVGDLVGKPWWLFIEGRSLYGKFPESIVWGPVRGQKSGRSRTEEPEPPEPPEPPQQPIPPAREFRHERPDEWTHALLIGVSVTF